MKKRVITDRPGTFMGLSTSKVFEGKTVKFFDEDQPILEVSLNTPHTTKHNLLPGIEKYIFIRHKLVMQYPEEAEDDISVFIARD